MNTNRRAFLWNVAKGAIGLYALPLLTSCHGITRSELKNDDAAPELLQRLGKEKLEILRLAALAPNGHNTQPWTVTLVEPDTWLLGTEQARWLPAVDPENREAMLSMGAFLENLVVTAENFGYAVNIQVVAKTAQEQTIVQVKFSPASPKSFPLERIATRRTVRNHLLSKELSSPDLAFISGEHASRIHYFPSGSPQAKYLADATLEANRIQAYRDPAQAELANWIRWSNAEARTQRDGLNPESMEITGIAGWYVRTFYDRSDVLQKSFRETTIKKVAEQVQANGGWLVLTSERATVPDLLETGRIFQRLFLKVRERMIAVHPMTQMLEEAPSPQQIPQALGLTGQVEFILRTGYLKSYPEPVSLRRPVSWFTRV